LKANAVLRIGCADAETAGTLRRVLEPDNASVPAGLSLSMKLEGRTLSLDVTADALSTALSTCLAVIEDVRLFEQVSLLSRAPGAGSVERMATA
jgi:Transcription factor Pcc1